LHYLKNGVKNWKFLPPIVLEDEIGKKIADKVGTAREFKKLNVTEEIIVENTGPAAAEERWAIAV
jgi:hypothetical protein